MAGRGKFRSSAADSGAFATPRASGEYDYPTMMTASRDAAPFAPAAPRLHNRIRAIVISAGLLAVILTLGAYWYSQRLPKRFAEVVPGKLYRSGTISPDQLERLHREEGVRRVISLLDPGAPESMAERAAAERLGLIWTNVPLKGNGESTPADRDRIFALLTEPDAPPTLVHCAAGANRTGLAIGMYRLRCQGWSYEQVLSEMKQFDFEDEAHHENLRQALAEQARIAASQPARQP